ncbi:MAG TPA: sensor histidine kinase [Solirubrobacteraceae bacterium]|nr:sensor histidine kinase [Solirubrobacteraceae bacterium]
MTAIAAIVSAAMAYRAIHQDQPLALLLLALAIPPLFLRDRRPLAAFVMALAARMVIPDNDALLLPVLAVLYTIAARRTLITTAAASTTVIVATVAAEAAWGHTLEHGLLGYAVAVTASCAAAVALGLYGGARARLVEGLRERAERADRERELLAERAVAEERVAIAQELHDVVGHNVSLMVVQAQALGATIEDEHVTETTRAIADLGRQTMAEMHRTLTLLRADGGDDAQLAPQPGLANLDKLLEQSRAAGLNAELTIEGEPRSLDHAVDLSAFRIVQEALTNVIKHAGGARTEVTLSYRDDELRLSIVDSGDESARSPSTRPGEGHGVIGMRERANLFGGTLTAEPRPGHGFAVTATLPYAGGAS